LSADRAAGPGGRGIPADLLYLPPALAGTLEGPPVEQVLLVRDEMANLAWAVERVVENPLQHALDRDEAWRQAQPPAADGNGPVRAGGPGAPGVTSRLATSVPDHWIPLLPVRVGERSVRLKRGAMPRLLPDGSQVPILPQGRLLVPGRDLVLYDEQVPRAGAL